MWLAWLVAAVAAPLAVEVRPAEDPPVARPWAAPAVVIPVGGPAPPLGPLASGGPPPVAPARVEAGPGWVEVHAERLGEGWRDLWLVDPRGTREAWWRVEVWDGEVSVARCDAGALPWAHGLPVPTPAVACGPTSRQDAEQGAWSLRLEVPELTSAARVLRTVTGPGGAGGTWARGGASAAAPELGGRLDVPAPTGRAAVHVDAGRRAWEVDVALAGDLTPGAWGWRLVAEGREVAAGAARVDAAGEARLTLPLRTAAGALVELTAPSHGGVREAVLLPLPPEPPAVWVRTPVAGDVLTLGWRSAVPVRDVPLVVRSGRRARHARLDLPAGAGTIEVRGLPPGALTVGWGAEPVPVAR